MSVAGCTTRKGSRRPWSDEVAEPKLDPNIREALAMFADEISAHRYLERLRWPDGVWCPHCRGAKVGKLEGASTRLGTYKCYSCRKQFSLLHGTVMSASHVPTHKWLQALYLTECAAKPMRTLDLCRILNVSFKTASSMMRRISEAADYLCPVSTTRAPSPNPRSPSRPGKITRSVAAVVVSVVLTGLHDFLLLAATVLTL
jgi:transposase-like protein